MAIKCPLHLPERQQISWHYHYKSNIYFHYNRKSCARNTEKHTKNKSVRNSGRVSAFKDLLRLLHTLTVAAAICPRACVSAADVTRSFCSFLRFNVTRLDAFGRRTFSTADSSRASPARLYLFGFTSRKGSPCFLYS